jgi:hypothetical protein
MPKLKENSQDKENKEVQAMKAQAEELTKKEKDN